MPSNNNFNPFKFSLLSSLYISIAAYFVINYNDLSISVESVLISFIIFVLSFLILQLRVRKLFFERIRQIYEDLEFETDSLIKTSPIDSDMNSFSRDLEEFVKLNIINILGENIRTIYSGKLTADFHSFNWNGLDTQLNPVASGVYFVQLDYNNKKHLQKIMYMK